MDAISYFKKQYPHISQNHLQYLEGRAKEILLHLLYRSATKITDDNREYAYNNYKYWIIACMQEMIERMGATSAVSYSENGISISFGEAQLSASLKNEIVPIAGIS